jgi:hypothetical protein
VPYWLKLQSKGSVMNENVQSLKKEVILLLYLTFNEPLDSL